MRLLRLLPDLAAVTGRSRGIVVAAGGVLLATLAANLAHTQFGLGGEGLEKPLNAWGQNAILACACALVAVRVLTGGAPGSRAAAGGDRAVDARQPLVGLRPLRHRRRRRFRRPPTPAGSPSTRAPISASAFACAAALATCRAAPGSTGWSGSSRSAPWASALVVAPVLAGGGGHPRGRAGERRLPARGPAAARPHDRGARAARLARADARGRCWAAGFAPVRRRRLDLPRAARRRHLQRRHRARLAVGRRAGDHGARELAAARAAARGRSRPPGRADAAASLFAVAALALLVYAGLEHVAAVAVALAAAAVLAAMARTALTVREIRGFHEARRQAATDELTESAQPPRVRPASCARSLAHARRSRRAAGAADHRPRPLQGAQRRARPSRRRRRTRPDRPAPAQRPAHRRRPRPPRRRRVRGAPARARARPSEVGLRIARALERALPGRGHRRPDRRERRDRGLPASTATTPTRCMRRADVAMYQAKTLAQRARLLRPGARTATHASGWS